jgi:hypothetical protein
LLRKLWKTPLVFGQICLLAGLATQAHFSADQDQGVFFILCQVGTATQVLFGGYLASGSQADCLVAVQLVYPALSGTTGQPHEHVVQ